MTTLCGGGASEAKSTYTGSIVLQGTSIAAALALVGEAAAAEVLAPLIAGTTLLVEVFCGDDPPADPGIDQDVINAALDFSNPGPSLEAIGQIKDWFLHWYWCQVCTCSSGSIPNCGAPSSVPGINQSPGLPNQSNQGCFNNSYNASSTIPSSGFFQTDITQKLLAVAGAASNVTDGYSGGNFGLHIPMYPIPAGVTKVQFGADTIVRDPVSGTNGHLAASICVGTSSSAGTCNDLFNLSTTNDVYAQAIVQGNALTWPTGSTHWSVTQVCNGQSAAAGATESAAMTAVADCAGAQLGCCPPPPTDPNIAYKLDQILGLVSTIYSIIPVRVPNYAALTDHSGLTGQDTISLGDGTIAIRVVVDTLPAVYGQIDSLPDTFFDIGWVTPITNEGPEAGIRLSRTTQIIPLPEASSGISYSFEPGESVTITELLAG